MATQWAPPSVPASQAPINGYSATAQSPLRQDIGQRAAQAGNPLILKHNPVRAAESDLASGTALE
jgi:hypothetical protein